jgi:hypothetical protein
MLRNINLQQIEHNLTIYMHIPIQADSQKQKIIFHHRVTEGTEFYFVNCACGVVNNTVLFSVPSVTLW